MASKRPSSTRQRSQISELTEAVRQLNANFEKMNDRLFGDPQRQLKGLTQEVQDLAVTTERGLREAAEAIGKLNAGMTAVETFKAQQLEENLRFRKTSEEYDASKNQFLGGWKMVTILWTVGTAISSAITYLLTKE